jgi:hypothetical protein
VQNIAKTNTIQSLKRIFGGTQTSTTPNATYVKRISVSDDHIIEIADVVKGFLINPPNAPNTSQPEFAYNELTNPAITGQGVFWQVITDVTSTQELSE